MKLQVPCGEHLADRLVHTGDILMVKHAGRLKLRKVSVKEWTNSTTGYSDVEISSTHSYVVFETRDKTVTIGEARWPTRAELKAVA